MLTSQAVSASCPCKLLVQVARASCLCTLSAQVVSALACTLRLHMLSVQVVPASFMCRRLVCGVCASFTCRPRAHVVCARFPRKSPVQIGCAHCVCVCGSLGHVARAHCVCVSAFRIVCASWLRKLPVQVAGTRGLRKLLVRVARGPCHDMLSVLVGGARRLHAPSWHMVSAHCLRAFSARVVCAC